ncbi:hypothetical protein ANCCAN_03807 [Ancylostoma caninum]|uniref:Uncharacterized protein n=1 Tax=Ancylostoma caninum TaxID=29170 RepID=A0A368H0N9_ANCCA|nr:hypothetical protein ANCCAN_03807 [Ancylostoma caninum]
MRTYSRICDWPPSVESIPDAWTVKSIHRREGDTTQTRGGRDEHESGREKCRHRACLVFKKILLLFYNK